MIYQIGKINSSKIYHFRYHLLESNEPQQDVHKINLISLANLLKPNQELISIKCGDIINTHFIPQHVTKKSQQKNPAPNTLPLPSSILIFIIDATSRHDFHRKLRKTSAYLHMFNNHGQRNNHFKYEFLGYNIIGHSTNHNLQPFFFGSKFDTKVIINESVYRNILNSSLWSMANKNGYLTSLLWDDCKTQYQYKYPDPYSSPDHVNIVGCDYDFDYYGRSNLFQSGKGSISFNDKCNKQKFVFEHLLEYQTLLWQMNMENKNKIFSIAHTVVGHDGVGTSIKSMDDYLYFWLKHLLKMIMIYLMIH